MKPFRMLGRSIRDAFKSVIRNFSLSLASISCITITLVIVAIAIITSFNVESFTKEIERDLTIVVFLENDTTEEEIAETREIQELNKERIGYYGSYAKCRSLTIDEACEKIKNGEKFVVRFKSPGNYDNKVKLDDRMRGEIEFPENDLDVVIIKSSDGLPTYHFAHAVDDHLMHTTTVMRGEEWIPSYEQVPGLQPLL